MIEELKIIVSALGIIPIFVIPLYLILRVSITLFPVLLNYAYTDKDFSWYEGMNKHKALIAVGLCIFSFFIGWFLQTELPEKFNWPFWLILFVGSLAQVYILTLVKRKLSLSLKDTFRLLKQMFNSKGEFYPENLIDFQTKNNPSSKSKSFSSIKGDQLPFQIRDHGNKKVFEFSHAQNKFGIHSSSRRDFGFFINREIPPKPIIFTETYNESVDKQKIISFFLFYLDVYDFDDNKWKASVNVSEIKSFQEKHSSFSAENKLLKKDLDGDINIHNSTWYRVPKRIDLLDYF